MKIVKLKRNIPNYKGWLFEIILEGKAINVSSQLRSYINESDLLKIKSSLSFFTDFLSLLKILENSEEKYILI